MRQMRAFRFALALAVLAILAACSSTSTSAPATASPTPTAKASYSSLVLALHPTAYWKLDSNATTVADSSGNGNDGTLSAEAAAVPGPFASATALQFTGPQHINVPKAIGLGHGTSLELWVNYSASGAVHLFRSNGTDGKGGYSFIEVNLSVPASSPSHFFAAYNFPSGTGPTASMAITPGAWHHLVLTDDGTTDTLYQDGAVVGSGPTFATAFAPSATGIEFGSGGGKSLAQVAVYPAALTPAEVSSHWHAGCDC